MDFPQFTDVHFKGKLEIKTSLATCVYSVGDYRVQWLELLL